MNRKTLSPSTPTKAFIEWTVYRLEWHSLPGEHFAGPARSVSLYRRHPHNGEVNWGGTGESGSCSHTAGTGLRTQAWHVCIFVAYCGICWLQDHGTRSPTNIRQGQSSTKCSRTTRSVTVEVVYWSSQLLWQISARFIQCSCSPLQVIPEGNKVGLGRWAAVKRWRSYLPPNAYWPTMTQTRSCSWHAMRHLMD